MSINVKKKGNKGENALANYLYSKLGHLGLKFWRDSGSGGGSREKGDINNNADLTIEVKTVKAINLKKAWQQVAIASSKHGNIPLLAIHFDGMGKDEWLMVLHSEDFCEFFEKYNEKTN